MGVTGAQASVDPQRLEAVVKDTLDVSAPRTMVVLAPLKVTILNFPYNGPTAIDIPDFPKDPQRGSHTVTLDKIIFIDRSDFREVSRPSAKIPVICNTNFLSSFLFCRLKKRAIDD